MLGIAPGVQALAYSVLAYRPGVTRAELLDADVLRAGRKLTVQDAIDVARRCRAHQLILDVVLKRHPPALIVLGPQANPREDIDHVAVVRYALQVIGQTVGVPVTDLPGSPELYAALGVDNPRGVSQQIRNAIEGPQAVPRDKRALLAVAAAVAGGKRVLAAAPPPRSPSAR